MAQIEISTSPGAYQGQAGIRRFRIGLRIKRPDTNTNFYNYRHRERSPQQSATAVSPMFFFGHPYFHLRFL